MFERNRSRVTNQSEFRKARGSLYNVTSLEFLIRKVFNKIHKLNTYVRCLPGCESIRYNLDARIKRVGSKLLRFSCFLHVYLLPVAGNITGYMSFSYMTIVYFKIDSIIQFHDGTRRKIF